MPAIAKVIAFTLASLSILTRPSLSWTLPEIPFLEAFVDKFQREGMKIFLPRDNRNNLDVVVDVEDMVVLHGRHATTKLPRNAVFASNSHGKSPLISVLRPDPG